MANRIIGMTRFNVKPDGKNNQLTVQFFLRRYFSSNLLALQTCLYNFVSDLTGLRLQDGKVLNGFQSSIGLRPPGRPATGDR
jgi:hypothetical protein